MLTSLAAAKARGCKIVSVNPLPETGNFRFKNPQDFMHPGKLVPALFGPGAKLSDLWLPVRLSGDMAAFKGISKHLLEVEAKNPGSALNEPGVYPGKDYGLRGVQRADREDLLGGDRARQRFDP
jgi:hypothetical protein